MEIETNEAINQPNVVFQSGGYPITNQVSYNTTFGTTWTAKYVVSDSDAAGNITFTLDASDLVGNNATQATGITYGDNVTKLAVEITTTTETTTPGNQMGSVLEGNYENSYYGQNRNKIFSGQPIIITRKVISTRPLDLGNDLTMDKSIAEGQNFGIKTKLFYEKIKAISDI